MDSFDLVIRNGTVATASDIMQCDVGIKDGKVAMLGRGLPPGGEEIDASGKLVLPGGVDAHCHLDQPMEEGLRMADDFRSGTISAACGGTRVGSVCAVPASGNSDSSNLARRRRIRFGRIPQVIA